MPIPNLPSLGEMMTADQMSPMMFQQAQNQIALGNQGAQLGLEQGRANLEAQVLKNLFDTQNNPQLLQSQVLSNQGQGQINEERGRTNKMNAELNEDQKAAKRAEFLKSADEDALKQLQARGEAMSIRGAALGDTEMEAKGRRMMDAGRAETKARLDRASKEETARQVTEGRMYGYELGLRGKQYAADKALEGRQYSADVQRRVAEVKANAKNDPKTLEAAYIKAVDDLRKDPTNAGLKEYADAMWESMSAAKQFASGVKADLNELGVPTVGTPARPAITQRQPGGIVNAPPQTPSQNTGTTLAGPSPDDRVNVLAQEYKSTNDPALKESLKREAARLGFKGDLGGGATPAAPKVEGVKQGYVAVFKDGKPVGQAPAANADKLRAAGYTVN